MKSSPFTVNSSQMFTADFDFSSRVNPEKIIAFTLKSVNREL
jgi:hypothetical protein